MQKTTTISLALLALVSCSKPEKFTIKGEITGRETGQVVLMKNNGTEWVGEDTAKIENGKFVLEGKADLPELRVVTGAPNELIAQFFAENGTITLKAYNDSLDKSEVTGTKSTDEYALFMKEITNLNKEVGAIQQRYMIAQQQGSEDGMQRAQIDYEAMMKNQDVFARNFIREHRNSPVSPFIVLMQFGPTIQASEIDTLVAFLDPSTHTSSYVQELKKIAEKQRLTEVGAIAPDFTSFQPDGSALTLSSLRGKYVMIDFWASWCGPCRQENPNVVAIYNKYQSRGFDIIGVSLDKDKENWLKAIQDDQLTWHHVSDLQYWQSAVARQYGISSIPSTILLDKEGKIIAKNLRGQELAKKLAELLGE